MDPNACFSELLDALAEGDENIAKQHARNLREWLAAGGYYPGGEKIRRSAIDAILTFVLAT